MLMMRVLCERCEKAEASVWCISERAAHCERCDIEAHATRATAHDRVPIPTGSVIAALCSNCSSAPASMYSARLRAPLCDVCSSALPHSRSLPAAQCGVAPRAAEVDILLRDTHLADTISFDRMDFSALYQKESGRRRRVDALCGDQAPVSTGRENILNIDLSYFQTKVPSSLRTGAPSF